MSPTFFGKLDIGEYVAMFERGEVGIGLLTELTEENLQAMGVRKMGQRHRIIRAARELRICQEGQEEAEEETEVGGAEDRERSRGEDGREEAVEEEQDWSSWRCNGRQSGNGGTNFL